MNDVLQMYQRFDTTEVQRREMHRSRLKSHFAKRSDERRALIDAGGGFQARSVSHWSPYDRVGVVNADP